MTVQFESEDTLVVISVEEIDHGSCDEFAAELAEGLRRYAEAPRPGPGGAPAGLRIDLSHVRFLDSSGIRALIDTDIAVARQGGRVVVVGAQGVVRRCLEVTGVLAHLQGPEPSV